MRIKRVLAVLSIGAFVTPAFADMPDGHGGRTSPQAQMQAAQPQSARVCCQIRTDRAARQTVGSPAELKASGHLAWVARSDEPSILHACCKETRSNQVIYSSPAELKALGHVAPRHASGVSTSAVPESKTCC